MTSRNSWVKYDLLVRFINLKRVSEFLNKWFKLLGATDTVIEIST